MKMTAHEQFCFSTTRIESTNTNTSKGCVGTGFYFTFSTKSGKTKVLLITNKHVINDSNNVQIHISKANENGEPNLNSYYNLNLNGKIQDILYAHPNPQIDLCALDITTYMENLLHNGNNIFFRSFKLKDIPTQEQILDIDPIAEVEMVGYPNALWDDVHNMPLFRRCFTASRLDLDWQGKKVFLLDGACVEGSSGSPIILYNDGSFYSRMNDTVYLGQSRMFLLGIQYARANRLVEGELKMDNGQKINNLKPIIDIPNNIGYAIKSECIKDIIDLIN